MREPDRLVRRKILPVQGFFSPSCHGGQPHVSGGNRGRATSCSSTAPQRDSHPSTRRPMPTNHARDVEKNPSPAVRSLSATGRKAACAHPLQEPASRDRCCRLPLHFSWVLCITVFEAFQRLQEQAAGGILGFSPECRRVSPSPALPGKRTGSKTFAL